MKKELESVEDFLVEEEPLQTSPVKKENEISEEYFKYVYDLVRKIHVLKQDQLLKIMKGKFPDYPSEKLLEIVLDAQKNNYILISKDGYVMTEAYYKMLTDDTFGDGTVINNYYFRIKANMKPLLKNEMAIIKCMAVVADCMPISQNFFLLGQGPWTVGFVTPEEFIDLNEKGEADNAFYYEVAYIPHASSTPLCVALENSFDIKDKHTRTKVKRIAVLEDEDDSYKIPKIGFTNIVTVDDDGSINVIEQRTTQEEIWK